MMPDPAAAPDAPVGAALREAKLALRERVMAARDALPAPKRAAASEAIAERLAALASFSAAEVVLLTLPFRSEWDSSLLVRRALAAAKTLVLPRVDTHARMLALHAVSDLRSQVVPGYRGIPEPRADCPTVAPGRIEWTLVPGVAFDTAGGRLGYGGGFYDRLLPLLAPGCARVAGAFEIQIVAQVPAAPHDCRVDAVVTERSAFVVGR